jgi:hypothetical protein
VREETIDAKVVRLAATKGMFDSQDFTNVEIEKKSTGIE